MARTACITGPRRRARLQCPPWRGGHADGHRGATLNGAADTRVGAHGRARAHGRTRLHTLLADPALHFWRSPAGQPAWARPALLAVTALAGFAYAWGMNGAYLEPFYGGAARSMSMSWHDFIFGAADPWGTVSVDKLPGALWLQALSLRIFGFHVWALVLPQVVEGMLTVLVLYRAVRRVAGAGAGITAAVVMASSPIVILLDRGNISDSLLILLLVLAADATIRAAQTGRLRSLVWAGVLVGFAFQAKMLQAWLVLPAFFLAYLVAAPVASFIRRVGHLALATLATVVVSLSWMSAVSLVPASSRPYVDGSCNDSLFNQVFSYNGFSRLGGSFASTAGCNAPSTYLITASKYDAKHSVGTFAIAASWDRLLRGPFGHDDAWLLLPALVATVWLLVLQRRRPRTDPLRASVILWFAWLVLTFGFFSGSLFLNSYYTAALDSTGGGAVRHGLRCRVASAAHPCRAGGARPPDGRHRRRNRGAGARVRRHQNLDRRLHRRRRPSGGRDPGGSRAPAMTASGPSPSARCSPPPPCSGVRRGPRRSSCTRASARSTRRTRRCRSTTTPRRPRRGSRPRWRHSRSSSPTFRRTRRPTSSRPQG